MASYTQANRAVAVQTPLGPDALLLEKVTGSEAVSELFRFQLEMLAPAAIDFGKVLNQPASVRIVLPNGSQRLIHGIIASLSQGGMVQGPSGKDAFIRYSAELVPALWRLTRRVHSRVFQNLSVTRILETILRENWHLDVACIWTGRYENRNYCTQYQESDFAFVSRLMEEEGIGYYFRHETDDETKTDKHTLVLTDAPSGYARLGSGADIDYQPQRGGTPTKPVVWDWTKRQEIPSGQHTLSDYHFQVPASRLLAKASVDGDVAVGQTKHALRFSQAVKGTEMFEAFVFPGAYAQRFDDIDALGKPRGKEMQKLHDDSKRTANLRAQEAGASALRIDGAGSCVHFTPGNLFSLARHFDANGDYLLTRVEHTASIEGAYTSGDETGSARYENHFQALPAALPYRPRRVTPRPRIDGVQTATVTGPDNVPIWVDLYGRVKIKFHWDRSGPNDSDSSCWVRVSQSWAGPRYGAFFWPRPGHEVVIAFEHGDPDRPLITGSVYNDQNMPPLGLPGNQSMTGIKSCSLGGEPMRQYNWLVFHDEPGSEHFHLHSETHEVITSESSKRQYTAGPRLDIQGSSIFDAVGSGAGGGATPTTGSTSLICASFPPPGSGSGGGILDGLDIGIAIKGESASGPAQDYEKLFPGVTSYTAGSKVDSILLGDRCAHILAGSDVRLVFDLEAMLTEAASEIPGVGLVLSPFIGGGLLSTILGGVAGSNALVLGPNTTLTYWGPNVGITRGETIAYKTKSKNPGPLILAFLGLTTASAVASDIMGRIYSLKEKDAAAEEKKAEAREKIAERRKADAEARKARAVAKKAAAEKEIEKAKTEKKEAEEKLHEAETPAQHAAAKHQIAEAKAREKEAEEEKAAREREEKDAEEDVQSAEAAETAARSAAETAKHKAEGIETYVAWAGILSRIITNRFLALLNFFEGLTVRMENSRKKAKETTRLVKHIPLLDPAHAAPAVHAAAHGAKQTTVLGLGVGEFLLGHAAAGHHAAKDHDADIHTGDFTIAGKNVSVVSRVDPPPPGAGSGHGVSAVIAAPEKSFLNLIAEGSSGAEGIVTIIGTHDVSISQNPYNRLQLSKGKSAELVASEGIDLWVSKKSPLCIPRIKITDRTITLSVGPALSVLSPRIVISDAAIKLMVGTTAMIEVTATGIHMAQGPGAAVAATPAAGQVNIDNARVDIKSPAGVTASVNATSGVDVTTASVTVKSLKVDLKADLTNAANALQANDTASAIRALKEALLKIGG